MAAISPVMSLGGQDSTMNLDHTLQLCASMASLDSDAASVLSDHGKVPMETNDSSAPVSPASGGSVWKLVWCAEGCFKKENAAAWTHLEQLATSLGGKLEPMKKAMRFRTWVSSMQGKTEFSIITDWREAQPCLQALVELEPLLAAPVLLIALYEPVGKENRLRKAKKWARGPPELKGSTQTIRVRVVESLEEASAMTEKFRRETDAKRSYSATKKHMKQRTREARGEFVGGARADGAAEADTADEVVPPMGGGTSMDKVDHVGDLDTASVSDKLGKLEDLPMSSPASPTSPPEWPGSPFHVAQAGGMPAAVMSMMLRACPSGNLAELQAMLNSAAPSEYID